MISTKSLYVLSGPEVQEVHLESGKPPIARAGGDAMEIDPDPLSTDEILQFLFSVGGSRHVDTLESKPAQWRSRVDAVGSISINASMSGDVVTVTISRSEATAAPGPSAQKPAAATADPPPAAEPAPPPPAPPAPAPPQAPTNRPSTLLELLGASFRLALDHYLAIFAIAALALVPTLMAMAALGGFFGGALKLATSAASIATLVLVEIPLMVACVRALGMMREPLGLQPSLVYGASWGRLGALAVVVVLSRVAPVPLFAVLVGGFLYLRFFVALPAMLAEGLGPIAALGRSWELTGKSLAETVIMVLGGLMISFGFGFVDGVMSALVVPFMLMMTPTTLLLSMQATLMLASIVSGVISAIMWSLVLPFLASLSAVLYREMRIREVLAAPAGRPAPAESGSGGPFRSATVDPMAAISPWPLDASAGVTLGAPAPGSVEAAKLRAKQVLAVLVAAAAFAGTYWGYGRWRYERSLQRASLCVARWDVDCAGAALSTARSAGEEDARFRVVEVDAALLSGDRRQAEALLRMFTPESDEYDYRGVRHPMHRDVRAALLLLRGDLALTRGKKDDAKRDIEAARPLVPDAELVDARLSRYGLGSASPGSVSPPPPAVDVPLDADTVGELRTDFLKLLAMAPNGETTDELVLQRSLEQRISDLQNAPARSKLNLALGAIRDAVQQAKYNQLMVEPDQAPKKPTPPDEVPSTIKNPRFAERERQKLWKRYEVELARYNEAQDRRFDVRTKDEQKLTWKLQEAKRIVNETFLSLEGH